MLSLFSLLGLPNLNSDFYGLPDFASALVFELFSIDGNGDGDGPASDAVSNDNNYPAESDLWVRFYFRNGSDFGTGLPDDPLNSEKDYRAYPIFGHGPDQTSLPWADFEMEMQRIMLSDVGNWCDTCAAASVFCPAYTDSDPSWSGIGSGSGRRSRSGSNMTPQVAGVIGAAVTLGVLLLALLAAALFGVRLRKQQSAWSKRPSDLGGFKGSAKLASDQDLTLAKNGAPMAGSGAQRASEASTVVGDAKGHERVGSWELKQPNSPTSPGGFGSLSKDIEAGLSFSPPAGRTSFDDGDEIGVSRPVRPRESI
jgi:hypothetical protein